MLLHTALEVHFICQSLKLSDQFNEHIWSTMKYILSSEPQLLIGRHLHQLIICSVYGICKVFNQPLKFQEICSK